MDSDRIEGKLKEGEGKLTGDEALEKEGQAQDSWGKAKDSADDALRAPRISATTPGSPRRTPPTPSRTRSTRGSSTRRRARLSGRSQGREQQVQPSAFDYERVVAWRGARAARAHRRHRRLGITFVQVKDAVTIYPLFAFLTVRFAIASLVLVVPASGGALARPAWLGRGRRLGLLLALGYALQTGRLERTTVSNAASSPALRRLHTAARPCSCSAPASAAGSGSASRSRSSGSRCSPASARETLAAICSCSPARPRTPSRSR